MAELDRNEMNGSSVQQLCSDTDIVNWLLECQEKENGLSLEVHEPENYPRESLNYQAYLQNTRI